MREVFNVMIGMFIFAILLFVFFTFTNLINSLLSDTLREEQIEQQYKNCIELLKKEPEQFVDKFDDDFYKLFEVVIQLGAILAVVLIYFKTIFPWGFGKDKEDTKNTLS